MREVLAHRDWAELAAEVGYDAKMMAAVCHVSLRTLEREFQEWLHTSPQRWLDWFRTLKGRELIDAGMRTKEAANLLGFKQASHFCRKISEARAGFSRNALVAKLFTILSLTDNLLPLVT